DGDGMSIFTRVKKPAPLDPNPPAGVGGARREGAHPQPAPLTQGPPATKTNGVHPLLAPKPFATAPLPGIAGASALATAPAPSPASPPRTNGAPNGHGTSAHASNGAAAKIPTSTSAPTAAKPAALRDPASGPIDLVIEMAL